MNVNSDFPAERFWSKVSVSEKRRCWIWRGAKTTSGYGSFKMDGVVYRAPRVAYWLRNGSWPDNACHTCDNCLCCNPYHIFSGTRSENMQDMIRKGRGNKSYGEAHPHAVLTVKQVIAIRHEYSTGEFTMAALSKKHGASYSAIRRLIRGETWKSVADKALLLAHGKTL